MKRIAIAVSIVGLIFGVAILAQTQTQGVEQELIKLENECMEAVVKHDQASIEKLDRMLADEFVMTFDGSNFTKAQLFEFIKTREDEILSYEIDEWKVGVYGDAAVVMARNTLKMRSAGKETTSQNRFTDTWVKRDGRWQCVTAHNSTVPQK
jgi:ketosteroid isomerase-like protein